MSDNCCRVINALYHVLFPDGHENMQYNAPIHGEGLVSGEGPAIIRRLVERAYTSCDCEQLAWVIEE